MELTAYPHQVYSTVFLPICTVANIDHYICCILKHKHHLAGVPSYLLLIYNLALLLLDFARSLRSATFISIYFSSRINYKALLSYIYFFVVIL